jgi:hypothetical protein
MGPAQEPCRQDLEERPEGKVLGRLGEMKHKKWLILAGRSYMVIY